MAFYAYLSFFLTQPKAPAYLRKWVGVSFFTTSGMYIIFIDSARYIFYVCSKIPNIYSTFVSNK